MLVIATTSRELDGLRGALAELRLTEIDVLAPSEHRRVVLARVPPGGRAVDAVNDLRQRGWIAASRPDQGAPRARWSADSQPVELAAGLFACPAWSEHPRPPGAVIELGWGGFGNGHHQTTRLLIDLLVERVDGGERVLDVGCGSGILALAALHLGASSAVGVDIDEHAVAAVPRHAAVNGFADRLTATADPLRVVDGRFDIVVANIARAGVAELADDLRERLDTSGWLAVSGVSVAQCEQIGGLLSPLVEVERRVGAEWAALAFVHP